MDDYPLYLYIYDANGKHGKPLDIPTALGLRLLMQTEVATAVREGREVRITDTGDFIVFHAKDGAVLFPTEAS